MQVKVLFVATCSFASVSAIRSTSSFALESELTLGCYIRVVYACGTINTKKLEDSMHSFSGCAVATNTNERDPSSKSQVPLKQHRQTERTH